MIPTNYGLEKTNSAFVESYRKQMNTASLIENRDFTLSTWHFFWNILSISLGWLGLLWASSTEGHEHLKTSPTIRKDWVSFNRAEWQAAKSSFKSKNLSKISHSCLLLWISIKQQFGMMCFLQTDKEDKHRSHVCVVNMKLQPAAA